MYALFNDRLASSKGVVSFPTYEYLRKGLHQSLETVLRYHRRNPTAVGSDHLLVRILQSLNVSLAHDVNIYRDLVDDAAGPLSMALQLTSPLAQGRVKHPGVLYGEGSSEIWVAVESKINLKDAVQNWQNLAPVQFLSHPKTDLGLDIPKGVQNSDEVGLSVITVDIPLLAIQYRQWRLLQRRVNPDAQLTVNHFVAQYPLPNSLQSQLDIAVFNRMSKLYVEGEPGRSWLKHSFHLTDYSKDLDRVLRQMLDVFQERLVDWDQLLESFVCPSNRTYRDVIRAPYVIPSRQTTWALVIARLNVMGFLLLLNSNTNNQTNNALLNVVRKSIQDLRSNNAFRAALPRSLFGSVQRVIDTTILPYL